MFTMVVKKIAVKTNSYVRINGTLYGEAPRENDIILVMNKHDKIFKARVLESTVRHEIAGVGIYKQNVILGLVMDVRQIGLYDVVTDVMQNVDSNNGYMVNTRLLGLNRACIEDPDNEEIRYLLIKDLVEDAFFLSIAADPQNFMTPAVVEDLYGNKIISINTNEAYMGWMEAPQNAVLIYTQYSDLLKPFFVSGEIAGVVIDLYDPERLPNQTPQVYPKEYFFNMTMVLNEIHKKE